MKLNYRIDFEIDEGVIETVKKHLSATNKKINKKNIEAVIKAQLWIHGDLFVNDTSFLLNND